MEASLRRLEHELKLLKAWCAGSTIALLALALLAFRAPDPEDGILRARGLILVDEAGRERILLGAPIPAAENRVRTDEARVKEVWGPRFPPEYLDFYEAYRHDMNGLLILDGQGFDRIALGDPVPDPNIGQRIAPSTGLAINDHQGYERTGYGVLRVDDHYRVALGLDSAQGSEGLMLFLHDDGPVGLMQQDGERSLYLGRAPGGHPVTGLAEPFHGLLLRRGDEIERRVDATPEK